MEQGFSLVELMVSVSLTLILLTVGIPSFQSLMLSLRGSTLADTLVTSINYARSEAILRNSSVTLCSANDAGTACRALAANWNTGWIALDVSSGNVLRFWPIRLTGADVELQNNNANRLLYDSSGEAVLNNGVATVVGNIRFNSQITGCTGTQRRQIDISLSGAIAVSRVNCI